MKNLRRFCAAAVLTFAFAFSAFAGEMDFPVAPPPPPQQATTAGEMGFPVAATSDATSGDAVTVDSLREVALTVLGSVFLAF